MRYTIETESEMLAFGESVALRCGKHGFIALYGDLGAGKTVFARGDSDSILSSATELPLATTNSRLATRSTISSIPTKSLSFLLIAT